MTARPDSRHSRPYLANFREVIRAELFKMGGKADTVALARRLDLDAHGLAWELEQANDAFVNVNGEWMPNTVFAAVLAYLDRGSNRHSFVELPVAQVRDDVERIVQQHADTGSVHFTPRGGHGAGDFEVFDAAGEQIALVSIYTDGRVEALPVVRAEIVDMTIADMPAGPELYRARVRRDTTAASVPAVEVTVEAQTLSEAAELLGEAARAAAGQGALATATAMACTADKLRDAVNRAQEA
jgi:hypothetical protein